MKTKKWREMSRGDLSVENIQQLFVPLQDYRVSKYEYPVGTEFPGQMRAGTCFVLSGNCRYRFEDGNVTLSAGDVIDFPSGSYTLSVLGENTLVIILVWKLSELTT